MASSSPRTRRQLPGWAKALLWVTAMLVALVAAGLVWLASVLSGGLDDLIGGPGPSADDQRVVAAQERADSQLREESARLRRLLGAADATDVLTGSSGDCREGQHNWKIDDSFDLRCTQIRVTVLPAGDVGSFREQALDLHARLLAEGWRPRHAGEELTERSSIAWVVAEYWDQRATFPDPDYGPGNLPAGSYQRDHLTLTAQWLDPSSSRAAALGHHDLVLTDDSGREVGHQDAGRRLPNGGYATTLVLGTEYFYE